MLTVATGGTGVYGNANLTFDGSTLTVSGSQNMCNNSIANVCNVGLTYTAPFAPTTVSGCTLWLDGADTSTMTFSSSSNLATWRDKSTSLYTASNFGTPVYAPNIQNTRGVIQFATGGGVTVPSFVLSPQMSVFMVYYPNGQGTNGPPIEQSSNSSLYPGFLVESGISNFLIRTSIPAPSGLTFAQSGTTVVGSWSAYTGASTYFYTLYSNSIYSYTGGSAVSGASATLTAPTATFTYSSPVSGTYYYYTVSVTTSVGTSLLSTSEIVQFTTLSTSTSGGTIVTSGTNRYHIFTSNANFVASAPSSFTVNAFLIGGGGGGGSSHGGGGGAGELIYTSASITNTTYSIVVGTGGPTATNGVASSAFSISTNYGGKGGGNTSGSNASTGGSGGGGCGYNARTSGAASVKTAGGLGNAGGAGTVPPPSGDAGGGGGGGGAGVAGSDNSGQIGGVGGNGTNSYSSLLSIISSSMPANWQTATSLGYIAGGGGGGCYAQPQGTFSAGGLGGGGYGGNENLGSSQPSAGIAYTGSGGGGGGSGGQAGAAGASGLAVIIVPTNVSFTSPTSPTLSIISGTATLGWTAASGALSYNWSLYNAGTSNSYTGTILTGPSNTASTNATVSSGLTLGNYYYFAVQSSNASGVSSYAPSSIVQYVPAPTSLSLTTTSSNATLGWSSIGSGQYYYTLYSNATYSYTGGTAVASNSTSGTSAVITQSITTGAFYYFSIYQVSSYGTSSTYYSPIAQYIDLTAGDTYFSSVGLLIQGGGANGTSNITDLAKGQTINQVGTATTFSSTQTKFASTSIYFPGTGNLSIPYNSNTAMPGDFTWEVWVYQVSRSGMTGIFGTYPDASNRILFSDNNNTGVPGFYWEVSDGGTRISDTYPPLGTYSLNTWTHLALTRSGNNFYTYVNGTRVETTVASVAPESSHDLLVGACYNNALRLNGYIDGLRYTKGVARYTGASFALPTTTYPLTSPSPSAPTSPTLSITSGTATLGWVAASGATSNYWTLYRSTSNGYYGTSNASGTTTGSATAPVTAPTGLTSGGYWYFTVTASNAGGFSPAAVSSIISY